MFAVPEQDVSYTLWASRWHQLLDQVGSEIAITVRVPTPLDDPSRAAQADPSLFAVGQRLRHARVQFHNQEWETSVGTCRQALEALGHLHSMPTTKTIDGIARQRRNQEERWAAIHTDVMSLSNVAHHQDSLTAGFVWTRATPTQTSQAAGQASLGRIFARQQGRDAETSLATKNTRYHQAVLSWGVQDWESLQRLVALAEPTLILQGDSDIMIPPKASHNGGAYPDARIKIYPDASHGSIFQCAEEAAVDTLAFVDE